MDYNHLQILNYEYGRYYLIIGKSLAIATNFESDVNNISTYIKIKSNYTIFSEDEETMKAFFESLSQYIALSKRLKKR